MYSAVTLQADSSEERVRHDTHEIFHQESSKPIVEAVTEGLCEKERQALVHRLPGESSESYYDRLTAAVSVILGSVHRKYTEEYFRALEAMTRKDLTTIGKLELLGPHFGEETITKYAAQLVYMSFTPTAEGQEEFLSHMPEIYNEISDGNAIYTLKNHSYYNASLAYNLVAQLIAQEYASIYIEEELRNRSNMI